MMVFHVLPRALLLRSLLITGAASPLAAGSGFLENRGQVDRSVRYYARSGGVAVFFTDSGLVLDVRHKGGGCAARMSFADANPEPCIEARAPLVTRTNFFLGSDPQQWLCDVPSFGEIVYHEVWPGIDLVFRDTGSTLECEPMLAPAADRTQIRFAWVGAEALAQSGYFAPPQPNTGSAIDHPEVLAWSTFLGGTSDELALDVGVDSSQEVLVTGLTISTHFPTSPGAYDGTYNGSGDVFVSKLDGGGKTLLWSTFLGGSGTLFDYGYGLAIDASGNPVVTGYTGSNDFPTTPGAYDRTHNGAADAFVAKLSADGSQLLWSTFLGAGDHDIAYSVALDSAQRPVVVGRTLSFNYPTTSGAFDTTGNGEEDVFVTKLDAAGSALVWSTLLGGSLFDQGRDVVLDAADQVLVVGYTSSIDFPTTPGAYDPSYNGGLYDVFVSKLGPSGDLLSWSTYLGGEEYEYGTAIAADAFGNPVVTGSTASIGFPVTPGAYDLSYNGYDDVFVTKLDGANSGLLWGTFLGGTVFGYEIGLDVAVDAGGNVSVTGATPSFDFPITTNAYDHSFNGTNDAFLSRFNPSGGTLLFSTFLGGDQFDYGIALTLDRWDNPVIAGSTASANFPVTSLAYDSIYNGGDGDVFVSKLRRAPARR